MAKNKEKSKTIYELMSGALDLEYERPDESEFVANEFEPRSQATRLMDKIYAARERLGRRLGTGLEDPDVLDLVEASERLQELLSRRLYDLGRASVRMKRK